MVAQEDRVLKGFKRESIFADTRQAKIKRD